MAKRAALQQDLTIGLHTVAELNHSIRYADTKAGALAAIQALTVTVLVARRDGGLTVFYVCCLALVLISALLLAAGQIPRLRASAANRIAFPALAAMPVSEALRVPSAEVRHEHVWRQASGLAGIALVKYRWLHRALISTFLTLAAVLAWLAAGALGQP